MGSRRPFNETLSWFKRQLGLSPGHTIQHGEKEKIWRRCVSETLREFKVSKSKDLDPEYYCHANYILKQKLEKYIQEMTNGGE